MIITGAQQLGLTSVALGLLSKFSSRQIRAVSAQGQTVGLLQELLPSLERFRYDVYIAELKKALPQADHLNQRLRDEDDMSAHHFIAATRRYEIDGCVRLHMSPAVPAAAKQALRLDYFLAGYSCPYGYVSKLMVRRTLRGGSIALQLMEAMVEFSRNDFQNAEIAFFHCSPKLTQLYEMYGFRQFGTVFSDPNVGQQVPMYFIPGDAEYFKEINSPLYRVAGKRPIHKEIKEHLLALLHPSGDKA